MKKLFIALCLASCCLVANAQTGWSWFNKDYVPQYSKLKSANFESYATVRGAEKNGYLPGYYLTKDGQKVEGQVQYNFPYIMERMLVFVKDGQMTFMSPRDIKGYFVDGIYRESVTVNVSMLASAKSLETYFMIPEIQGKLSLYYFTGETPSTMEGTEDLSIPENYFRAYGNYADEPEGTIRMSPKTRYMVKEGEPGKNVDGMALTFAKQMPDYIADCPDLAAKVKAKEKGYRSQNFEDIIKEYNQCAK